MIESGKRVVLRDDTWTQTAMKFASASLNFGSVGAGVSLDLTIALPGAVVGDLVIVSAPSALAAGFSYNAFVSAANVVTVRLVNNTAAPIDPAAQTWGVAVIAAG